MSSRDRAGMPITRPAPFGENERAALEHVSEIFKRHSTQRLQLLGFFFVSTAFLARAYTDALVAGEVWMAMGVAFLGAWVSSSFLLLELRTRALVVRSEEALSEIEQRLAAETGFSRVLGVSARGDGIGLVRFRTVLPAMYTMVALAEALAMAYALGDLVS
jgi:hypothetical protein